MATLVFVPGPFGPPTIWTETAEIAALGAYGVRTPNLHESLRAGAPYHTRIAAEIAGIAKGCIDPILVLHSGAGGFAPAIAAQTPMLRGAIFVDALMPHPGRAWRATAPRALVERIQLGASDGLAPKWSDWFGPEALAALLPDPAMRAAFVAASPRAPLALLEERAPQLDLQCACAYVRLSEGYEVSAAEAERRGWIVERVKLDHLALVTQPARVAALVLAAADALMAKPS